MVISCKLCKLPYSCNMRRERNISFHSVPRDPEIRRQWYQIIAAENGKEPVGNLDYMKVCSQHFELSCFMTKAGGLVVLKQNSIPTLKRIYSDGLVLTNNSPTDNTTPILEMTDIDEAPMPISSIENKTVDIDAEMIEQADDDVVDVHKLFDKLSKEVEVQRKQMNMYHMRCYRARLKRRKLIGEIASMRRNKDLPANLNANNTDHDEFIQRYFNKIEHNPILGAPGDDFKKFSLTLYNISSEAYFYIRNRFLNCLPHERILTTYRT